jgi:hypothetical protein
VKEFLGEFWNSVLRVRDDVKVKISK